MKINIFILNWNSTESVKECINSVITSNDKNFRVILINNFSTSIDLVQIRNIYDFYKEIIEIYLVENSENLGYAGGNNIGLKFLEKNNLSGNVLILNTDIQISKNTILEMGKALTDDVGIVTIRTLDDLGNIQFDAIRLNGFHQKNIITANHTIDTDYSHGSCMLINREVINQIGFFDKRFFLYWEEVDFSLRVKKHGMRLISITTSQVFRHKNSITRQPLAFYYSIRNARLIMSKHKENFTILSYILYILKMFLLIFKFLPNLAIFINTIKNFYFAILDSYSNNYFIKSERE